MQAVAAPACPDRDAELLAAVARGDRRAFEELYDSYRQRLMRFLLRLAPRHEIAEEVINDTFWVVWRKAKEFRGESRVSTWIMGIAYRRALKMLRAARADLPSAGGEPLGAEPVAIEPGIEAEQQDWLLQGLRQLPPQQRTSLELAYYLGYSCEEIADIMDCGVPAVKGRMLRARENLRVSLPRLAGSTANDRTRHMGSQNIVLALLAIGLLIWGAAPWIHGGATSSDARYRTVTLPAPVVQGATIRAVFAPSLAPNERRALLESAGLKIIAGPSAAGVYSLAPVSDADPASVDSALKRLRASAGVSFAEPIADAP